MRLCGDNFMNVSDHPNNGEWADEWIGNDGYVDTGDINPPGPSSDDED